MMSIKAAPLVPLKHAIAVAVGKQTKLGPLADHLQAHRDRSRPLERIEPRALQFAGKVQSADDGPLAVQCAADHWHRDRRQDQAD